MRPPKLTKIEHIKNFEIWVDKFDILNYFQDI